MASLPDSNISVPLSRRRSFNRMLELERKSKLERMQARDSPPRGRLPALSSHPPQAMSTGTSQPKSTSDSPPQNIRVDIRPRPLQLSFRTRSSTLFAERTSQAAPQDTSQDLIMPAVPIPDEQIDDDISDASSICQSPSWADYGGKKKKQKKAEAKQREKEQRKLEKEKEKAGAAGKTAQKPKRLVKAPPSSRGPHRSSSTPPLPTVPHSPVEEEVSTKFFHVRQPSSTGDGFSGGIKLHTANNLAEHVHMRQTQMYDVEDYKAGASLDSKVEAVNNWAHGVESYGIPGNSSRRSISVPVMDRPRPRSEKSFAARIAKEAQMAEIQPQSTLPVLEFEEKQHDRSRRQSTAWPEYGTSHETRQDKIRAAVQADLDSMRSTSRPRSRKASIRSPSRGSIMSIDSIDKTLPHFRSQSRSQNASPDNFSRPIHHHENWQPPKLNDEPLTPPYDEHPTSAANDRAPDANDDATLRARENEIEIDRYHQFLMESSRQATNDTSSDQTVSQGKAPAPSSLKNAARAAFSRKPLPTSSDLFSKQAMPMSNATTPMPEPGIPSVSDIKARRRKTVFNKGSVSKIEQLLGASVKAVVRPSSPPRPKTASASLSSISTINRSNESIRTSGHESSRFTTPTDSRPQSSHAHIAQELADNSSASFQSTSDNRSGEVALPITREAATTISHPPYTTDGKGYENQLVRAPAMIRSQSTPASSEDLGFLPELKHQALVRPQPKPSSKRSVTIDVVPTLSTITTPKKTLPSILKSSSSSPETQLATGPELPSQVASSADYLRSARLSVPGVQIQAMPHQARPQEQAPNTNEPGEPIAKMFVICCKCKFFHDLPSKIYEAMVTPDNTIVDAQLGVSGQISTMVRCPWCAHGMSTSCCAGYAAVVQLKERFH